jgi:hypothetical protein
MTRALDSSKYRAYLVRLWREAPDLAWRAGIENPHTGERRAFGSLDALFAFLADQAAMEASPPQDEEGTIES